MRKIRKEAGRVYLEILKEKSKRIRKLSSYKIIDFR